MIRSAEEEKLVNACAWLRNLLDTIAETKKKIEEVNTNTEIEQQLLKRLMLVEKDATAVLHMYINKLKELEERKR